MAKMIAFNQEAREAIKRGVGKLTRAVRSTLGPCGHTVLLDHTLEFLVRARKVISLFTGSSRQRGSYAHQFIRVGFHQVGHLIERSNQRRELTGAGNRNADAPVTLDQFVGGLG